MQIGGLPDSASGPQSGSLSATQWPAVITTRGLIREPPQNSRTRAFPESFGRREDDGRLPWVGRDRRGGAADDPRLCGSPALRDRRRRRQRRDGHEHGERHESGPPRHTGIESAGTEKRVVIQPIATMRSIGRVARSAISGGTLTSCLKSRSESRTFGRVIIFMYLQNAIRLASISFAWGAACWSG